MQDIASGPGVILTSGEAEQAWNRDQVRGPLARPLVATSCEDEQAWNQEQLRDAVDRPLVRLWTYGEPAVVLGCSQGRAVTPEEIDERAGLRSAVRQAGGGAVLAGPWMLSASIALPNTHPLVAGHLVQSYRWIGELYAKVLQGFGVDAYAISPDEARLRQQGTPPGLGWACFGGFSPWEVVACERKIVGLAQVRRRSGILLVAGLLLNRPEWELLARAMNQPAGSAAVLADCTTSCAEQLGRELRLAEVAAALANALHAALDIS
jgi:lipoate-protein ligase A